MTKEMKELLKGFLYCFVIAFAIVGIAVATGKINIINYDDIKLVSVNGNTNTEYIIEIGDVQYYKQGEVAYYYAQNQNLSE